MSILSEMAKELNNEEKYESLKPKLHSLLLQKDRRGTTELLTQTLFRNEIIYTTRDDEKSEMWIYKEGIYTPNAKTYIKEFCRKQLDEAYTTQIVNEVISKIEADTYIEQEEFFKNRNIWLIAVENGVIDLKKHILLPFNPNYFFFNKLPVTYEKGKDCPNIKKFFKSILKEENEINIIQELIGYCLLKDYKYEKAFMFTGDGRNGKGKTVELIKRFLGSDNCINISISDFEKDLFCVGELFNKMANIGADISNTYLDETGNFKSLVARDLISAPRKFLTRVNFTNYAKMIFCANELPKTRDKSLAFFNRWILINFPYTFLSEKEYKTLADKKNIKIRDKDIIDKISSDKELTGLLNWALEGLNRLLENDEFSYSYSTEEVKNEWLRKSSSLTAFLMDFIEEDYEGKIKKDDFRFWYSKYCRFYKTSPESDKRILRELTDYGSYEERLRNSDFDIRFWKGIKFKNNKFAQLSQDTLGFSTLIEKVKNPLESKNVRQIGKVGNYRGETILDIDKLSEEIYKIEDFSLDLLELELKERYNFNTNQLENYIESLCEKGDIIKIAPNKYKNNK